MEKILMLKIAHSVLGRNGNDDDDIVVAAIY